MNKMYKKLSLVNTLTIGLMIALNILFCNNAKAQTTLYSQNFDSVHVGLPTGWTRSSSNMYNGGWYIDTLNTNSSTGYTSFSGLQNIVVKHIMGTGVYTLTSPAVNTSNYDSISVLWGVRSTTSFPDTATSIKFYWSADTTAGWNQISFIETSSTSAWYLENDSIRLTVPNTGWNMPSVYFRWVADVDTAASGTWRFDDFNVTGVPASGINEVNTNRPTPKLFMQSNNILNVNMNNFSNNKVAVKVIDLMGNNLFNTSIETTVQNINLSFLPSGIYVISMIGTGGAYNQKLIVTH